VSITPVMNITSVGNSVTYNLAQQQLANGSISYALNPNIQFGDPITYVLETNNGLWTKRDTVYKTFGALTSQAVEDATTATNWTGNWSTTGSTFVSPSKSFTDSPVGNYSNNSTKTTTYVPSVDLTNASSAMVRFYAKWDIEADYDYVQFSVSTDNGATWIPQCGNYTVDGTSGNGSVQPNNQPVYEGTQSNWVLEEINLSDYLGQVIKFRFRLGADGGTVGDGFYYDDFEVLYNVDSLPSGIESNAGNEISVVPNPFSETLSVSGVEEGSDIRVYQLNGSLIGTFTMQHAVMNIPTESWSKGPYFLEIEHAKSRIVKLVVKQ